MWSATGIVAEVPSGALADRFSRRAMLVLSGLLQAAGYALWVTIPTYPGFAAGFVVWGLGGACVSGALEALLYDGMACMGAEADYPRLYGRVTAMTLVAQLPAAVGATVLFTTGGYTVAGWASVATCLAAAGLAARLPDLRPSSARSADAGRRGTDGDVDEIETRETRVGETRANEIETRDTRADETVNADGDDLGKPELGYLALLRSGLAEAGSRTVIGLVLAVSLLGGLDGLEEYMPLLAEEWGVAVSAVPAAILAAPLLGAAGAWFGGALPHLGPRLLASLLGVAVIVCVLSSVLDQPLGVAGLALAYGLYQAVWVVTDARLQARIEGPARATLTSVTSLGAEITAAAFYIAWALDLRVLVAAIGACLAICLPRLFRPLGRPDSGDAPKA